MPTGYGRLIARCRAGASPPIREHNDASEAERRIGLCNAGAMAFRVPDLAGLLGAHRQRQRQGRILPDRRRGPCRSDGLITLPVVCAPRGGDGRQFARAAGRRRSRLPERAPGARPCSEGATLIAPETVWLSFDTEHRPRRDHRAQRVLRPGRGGGGRRPHHGQLPPGRRPHRQGRPGRPVRALAPRRRHRRAARTSATSSRSRTPGSRRAPRPTIWPTSATAASARAPTSAPAPSSATTTASTSTSPTSARAPSSAPTRRWWRRSRSATAPTSARAASSPERRARRPGARALGAGAAARLGRQVPDPDGQAQESPA